jgi:hypothetical protein
MAPTLSDRCFALGYEVNGKPVISMDSETPIFNEYDKATSALAQIKSTDPAPPRWRLYELTARDVTPVRLVKPVPLLR